MPVNVYTLTDDYHRNLVNSMMVSFQDKKVFWQACSGYFISEFIFEIVRVRALKNDAIYWAEVEEPEPPYVSSVRSYISSTGFVPTVKDVFKPSPHNYDDYVDWVIEEAYSSICDLLVDNGDAANLDYVDNVVMIIRHILENIRSFTRPEGENYLLLDNHRRRLVLLTH